MIVENTWNRTLKGLITGRINTGINEMKLIQIFLFSLFSGSLQAACLNTISDTTPSGRFTDHGNRTVTDKVTGLMWKQCSEGLSGMGCGDGSATALNWQEALLVPGSVNNQGGFAGFTDWRLPNIKELGSIVSQRCSHQAINTSVFPNTPSAGYWSATPYLSDSSTSWNVNFILGTPSPHKRDLGLSVRLVR